MRRAKYFPSILLALCALLALSLLQNTARAVEVDYSVEGGSLKFDTDTGTITGHTEGVTVAEIPDKIEGVAVTSIGDSAFDSCGSLTGVVIPEGVTSIGNSAFAYCGNLTSVNIPEGVASIGALAFEHAGLTEVIIPGTVTSMGQNAFFNCTSLTSVTLAAGATSIGVGAFIDCTSLGSMVIPVSVKTIGDNAFEGCAGLTEIRYGGSSSQWRDAGGGTSGIPSSVEIHYTKYKITFDASGGTIADNGTVNWDNGTAWMETDEDGTLSRLPTVTKNGVEGEWYMDGNKIRTGSSGSGGTEFPGDTTVYAIWSEVGGDTLPRYTVTFDPGEGELDGSEAILTVVYGDTLSGLPVPIRDGYDFKGWYTEPEGGTQVTEGYAVTEDMTVYAHWERRTYTIHIDSIRESVVNGVRVAIVSYTATCTRNGVVVEQFTATFSVRL